MNAVQLQQSLDFVEKTMEHSARIYRKTGSNKELVDTLLFRLEWRHKLLLEMLYGR